MPDRILTVRVAAIEAQTPDINAYTLAHPRGLMLPSYGAGAHIDVHLPGGFARQYSLARAAPEDGGCERYVIGVKREAASRGGSAAMHERVRAGDLLAISTPRNSFPLQAAARRHLLLAGGIGMTPLLAMAQHLAGVGAAFTLCVFARNRDHLAFAAELADPALAPHVQLHFDAPAAAPKIDLAALLRAPEPGTHMYLCGPGGFMQAARRAAAHWPDDAVHAEYFAAPEGDSQTGGGEAFTLRLQRRGISVTVEAEQTAVEALHELGIEVPTSCEQGLCGTCVVGWTAQEGAAAPDHRDHCLTASERRTKVALCCSRAQQGQDGTPLLIDL